MNHVLRREPPLPRIDLPKVRDGQVSAGLHHVTGMEKAHLCFTTDSGPWQQRKWQTVPAHVDAGQLKADLPATRPLVAILTIKDAAERHVSSEYVVLTNEPPGQTLPPK